MTGKRLGIIGDVHGKVEKYIDLIRDNTWDYSVQLGDLGFKRHYKILGESAYDKKRHKFIAGNHDDYDNLPSWSLGNYGSRKLGEFEFFVVRGAESIDKHQRMEGVSYWRNEELEYSQMTECLKMWEKEKPKVVLTHECPTSILFFVLTNSMKENGSATSTFLQVLFEIHQPEMWFFGHHHNSKSIQFEGTNFRCLDELETFTLSI